VPKTKKKKLRKKIGWRIKRKPKYYSFLDIAIDIFYGIILYNVFLAFPGLRIEAWLIVFMTWLMLDYWWISRSWQNLPKHYLIDLYFVTAVMFIFSIWPNYVFDFHKFLIVTALFFLVDALYSFVVIFAHEETSDHKALIFYSWYETIQALLYVGFSYLFSSVTPFALICIFIPQIISFIVLVKKGYLKTKFEDTGNQPY